MGQLILAIGLTVAVVGFAMSNTSHVELDALVGEPIRIRLIFLLLIAYFSGAITAFFYQMIRRVVRKAERRRQFHLAEGEE